MSKKNKYSSFWIDNSFFGGDVDTTSENSTDIMRLVSYKRAVSNFVSIVTGQSIPVKFEQRGDSYTDGKTVTISSKINETDFDPIVGLALHEGSHVKLTDFDSLQYIIDAEYAKSNLGNWTEYWVNLFKKHNPDVELGQNFPNYHMDYFLKKYASPKIKDLVNVIEDRRIDHYIFTNAPGYKGYYQSLYDKFFNSKNIDKGLLSSEYRTNDWNSYFFRIINFINKNRDLNALPLLRQVWNMINLKNISRLNNTMEVVDLAVEIFKLIEDSIPVDNGQGGGESDTNNETEESQGGGGGSTSGDEPESDYNGGGGSGDSNNDSTEGDETDGDAEGSEVQTSPGNGELSDRQKRLLDKAIEKQRKFLNGEVKKSKISKTDNAKVEAANEAGVESREVGSDYEQSYWSSRKGKTNVTVINKLTKKLINSGAFDRYFLSPDTEGSRYEGNRENVMKGVQLGTVLGKRLKIRSEERSLSTPRMKNGKISGRLLHELGMGNINVFEQTQIDKHKPAFIHISIDASGSMNGGAFEKTIISSVAIAKAASMTNNLDVAISFRTCSGDGNSNYPLMMTAYDSRVDKFSKITQLFPHINATGTTPEGLCFESIMNDILKVDKSVDTYFINFSDGAPWYSNKEIEYSGQQAVQHTAKQVKKMTNAGIKVLSFFITSSSLSSYLENFKKMYGKTAEQISIDSLIPLARTLNKLFE